jgi:hypothetical protein
VFGSVIEISTLSVLDVGKHLTLRYTVASHVGDDHPRLVLQSPEQPFEEALGGFRIAPFLNEDVQRNTMLINRSPEIVLHALDPNTSSRCRLSPGWGRRRRKQLAKPPPNFLHQRRIVS